jgi:hypothetical protein
MVPDLPICPACQHPRHDAGVCGSLRVTVTDSGWVMTACECERSCGGQPDASGLYQGRCHIELTGARPAFAVRSMTPPERRHHSALLRRITQAH